MKRIQILAGNWKMNFGPVEALEYFTEIKQLGLKSYQSPGIRQVIFPAAYALNTEVQRAASEVGIELGAQTLHWEEKGAFTGELSGKVLKSIGIRWVLIGHSERRQLFGETDDTAARRFHRAAQHGLNAIYCIGEHLQERESGQMEEVLTKQVTAFANIRKAITPTSNIVWSIAYEPVWAIGTGKTATSEQAEQAHILIRRLLNQRTSAKIAESTPILYGGSVTPDNSQDLLSQPNIDGLLIGGASLKPESFIRILESR